MKTLEKFERYEKAYRAHLANGTACPNPAAFQIKILDAASRWMLEKLHERIKADHEAKMKRLEDQAAMKPKPAEPEA